MSQYKPHAKPQSLNELDGCIAHIIPASIESLADVDNVKVHSSTSTISSRGTIPSIVDPKTLSMSEKSWDSLQTAMLSLVLKKKIVIEATPDISDMSMYSITVSGNKHSLNTNDKCCKNRKESTYLKSYKTNILKIKSSYFKSSTKSIYLYSPVSTTPIKIGEVRKSKKGSKDMDIFDSDGNLLYVIKDDQSVDCKSGLGKLFSWSVRQDKKEYSVGNLYLEDAKTGEMVTLGVYCDVNYNRKEYVFTAPMYEIRFPDQLTEENKVLVTAALLSKVPKGVHYKQIN